MANNFTPIKDGDWQALNIMLEELLYGKSDTKSETTTTGLDASKYVFGGTGESGSVNTYIEGSTRMLSQVVLAVLTQRFSLTTPVL